MSLVDGGSAQTGCTLGGCFGASVFIIFCVALIVGFTAGTAPAAENNNDDGSAKLSATIEGTVTELKVKGKTIKIPATKGKSAQEEYLSGMTFSSECNSEEEKWYITMRWPYVKWRFYGGTALISSVTNQTKFLYAKKKVIVYNPKTKKSVVTAICESGPAPWTGSSWYKKLPSSIRSSLSKIQSEAKNNPPSFWTKPMQFDPPEADGRVSGLSPKAFKAIGAKIDQDLQYGFAEDQGLSLGLMK